MMMREASRTSWAEHNIAFHLLHKSPVCPRHGGAAHHRSFQGTRRCSGAVIAKAEKPPEGGW
ncbi:hypothetical protein BRPE64_DCDS08820 (plasmid) [Caballeronia insecticola]|uniref:Uncharacterized protein n=1 Tax=Caballeronia insecticola TaxID=758793 RepID=R4WT87_9BURK|nr:hypothetical protein BRPE64_DCDS08820 [Caballeronia insecticola]